MNDQIKFGGCPFCGSQSCVAGQCRMSVFKNETLAKIDAMVPAQMGKVQQVLLFTLIDEFINGGCQHEDEFINNLKAFLGVEE